MEEKEKCMRWYAGPLAAKLTQWYPQDCDTESVFEWSPCVSCARVGHSETSLEDSGPMMRQFEKADQTKKG